MLSPGRDQWIHHPTWAKKVGRQIRKTMEIGEREERRKREMH